jgi:arylsulfatase
MEISDLSPKAIDGVLNLRMNHVAHDDLLFGQWSAPRLGQDKKFSRSLLSSNSGIIFHVLKKEAYIVELDLSTDVPSLVIKINEKEIPFSERRFRKVITADDVNVGENQVSFLFSDPDNVGIKQIKIFPARFQKYANRFTPESDFLTPVEFHYYCNPPKGAQLGLSFVFQGKQPIEAKIIVESEKGKKEYVRQLKNSKFLRIPMLDESYHHIRIEIPEIDSPYIRLTQSQLMTPKVRTSPLLSLQKMAKDKNILLILLDAARPDHMSCYGYHRETTPNIDRLAEDGLRFDNVFVEAAYTLASTGSLLTGLPPDVHGVVSTLYSSLSDDVATLPELLQEKGYVTSALTSNPFFSSAYNYQQGFDHFIELFDDKKVVIGHHFLKPFEKLVESGGDRPLFMYLHLREPHTPYAMPEPFFGKYQKKYEQRTRSFHSEANRILAAENWTSSELQFMTDVYDENLAYADRIVGRLLEILKKNQILENTITIITSDHGEGLGEHGLLGHNVVLHKEGIHVPLIMHFPGIESRQNVVSNPAITSDLAVTLCELLDVDYPYSELSMGKNLFFLPEKRTRICRSIVLSSQYTGYMVDSYPYRAIIFPTLGQWDVNIFDISQDPKATQVLADDHFQKTALGFFLDRFIESTTKGFLTDKEPKLGDKEKERLKALGYIK